MWNSIMLFETCDKFCNEKWDFESVEACYSKTIIGATGPVKYTYESTCLTRVFCQKN